MKLRALLVALLAPLTARAQEATPSLQPGPQLQLAQAYPAEPVPPAPPAQPYYASRARRDSWYIGFGLGTGGGSASGQGATYSFRELNYDRSTTNLLLNFKVGATISPRLLLGFDLTAVRSAADQDGFATAVQVNNYDAVATFFPMETGLFVRGGLGLSAISVEADGLSTTTAGGANVLLGVGYAWWLGRSFNLTVNLDFSAQSYGSSNDKPESSRLWALYAGFDWY